MGWGGVGGWVDLAGVKYAIGLNLYFSITDCAESCCMTALQLIPTLEIE